MKSPLRCLTGAACALALAAALVACAGSPPTRLYVLAAQTPAGGAAPAGPTVGIDQPELPAYLDRVQIVTRDTVQVVNAAEFDIWGEPLRDAILRVLTDDLAAALGSRRVQAWPWRRAEAPERRVHVRVLRFERDPGGEVVLAVRWSLTDREGRDVLAARSSEYRERPAGAGYPATVAAMNTALAALGNDLARSLAAPEVRSRP